jgi:ribosome-associated protein
VRDVAVRDGVIGLGQLVKLAGLADSGADAKALCASGVVRVNDAMETRRGRRLVVGDVVRVAQAPAVRIVAASD